MKDNSLYERHHQNRLEQSEGICFGRITRVWPEKRLCEVKTFMGSGSKNDQSTICQFLSTDSNPEGDETTSIPRMGSFGLVFHIDGETFFFGMMKALRGAEGATTGKEPSRLTEGDKVISSVAGNKITLKSSGLIEIESSQTLKRIYYPQGNQIIDICSRYDQSTDGGKVTWENLNKKEKNLLNETLYRSEHRRDMARTFIIVEERGKVDATTLYKFAIGPGVPGILTVPVPIYEHTIDALGEHNFKIAPPGVPSGVGHQCKLSPDGSISLQSGTTPIGQFLFDVNGLTGETTIEVNQLTKARISPLGDVEITGPTASAKIMATGDVNIEGFKKITIDGKAGVDVTSIGPVTVKSIAGPITISGVTIALDGMGGGGGGATDFVLTFPTTISPFTGLPLTPFSTTVRASK